jgi:hypothetical protein
MLHRLRFAFLVVGLISVPIVSFAQGRVGPSAASRPVQATRTSALGRTRVAPRRIVERAPASSASIVHRASQPASQTVSTTGFSVFPNTGNGFLFPGATSFDVSQLLNNIPGLNNVPGLGFDYEFLNAINQNFAEQAFINPATEQEIALAERLSRFNTGFGDGFIPFWGGGYYEEPAEEQQQPAVAEEQEPASAPPESQNDSAESAPVEEPAPLPDIGEFVLVLHNGNQIKAVGFTHQNNEIVYITKDGLRGSFPATDLDAAATQQINQQHGTPLQLSL